MTSWAAENLDAATVQAFDDVIETGDVATINLALQGLQAQYKDNVGYENNMIQGNLQHKLTLVIVVKRKWCVT